MQRSRGRFTAYAALIGLVSVLGVAGQSPAHAASRAAGSISLSDPGILPTTDKTYYSYNSVNSDPLQSGIFLDMAGLSLTDESAQHLLRIDLVANQPITPTVCRPPRPYVQSNISNPGCSLQIQMWAVNPQTGATSTSRSTNEYDFYLFPYAQPNAQVSQVGNLNSTYFARPQIVRQQIWGHHFITWISTRQFPNHRVHLVNPIASSNRWVNARHDAVGVSDTVVGATALPDLWINP